MLSSNAPTILSRNNLRSENTSSFSFELRHASLDHCLAIDQLNCQEYSQIERLVPRGICTHNRWGLLWSFPIDFSRDVVLAFLRKIIAIDA